MRRKRRTGVGALALALLGHAALPAPASAPRADGARPGEAAVGQRGAGAAAPVPPPPNPRRVVRELRPRVRIVGRPDTAFTLAERMEHHHVPGVSLAVIDGGEIAWAAGFGTIRAGSGEPVDTTTLFLAGSISKPVFATGALRLVETGQLALDADANRSLESWEVPETRYTEDRPVTLRQLLSHTAGLTVAGFPGYPAGATLPTVPQILDGGGPANTGPVRNDTFPGARFAYSGGGYTVAQLMATDVTGKPFHELMQRLVLEPARMVHSTFRNPPPATHQPHLAWGHEAWDTPVERGHHVYPEMAAAGLWTTASDLARWALGVARSWRGEGGFLQRETAREMLSRQVELAEDAPLSEDAWGLGVALIGRGDGLRFGHAGRDEGFTAVLQMWPEAGRGLVVLTNGSSRELLEEIWRGFSEVYGLPGPPRIEKRVAPAGSITPAGLAGRYVGTAAAEGLVAEVRREGEMLRVEAPGFVEGRLLPENQDVYFDRDTGSRWRFVRPEDELQGTAVRLEVLRPGSDTPLVAERVGEGGPG